MRTVFRGAVLPATATLEHMDDAADNPTVVNTMSPRLVLRKVRLDRRPRLITQPENFPHRLLQGYCNALESHINRKIKMLNGF